jgi:hypothetical protein
MLYEQKISLQHNLSQAKVTVRDRKEVDDSLVKNNSLVYC